MTGNAPVDTTDPKVKPNDAAATTYQVAEIAADAFRKEFVEVKPTTTDQPTDPAADKSLPEMPNGWVNDANATNEFNKLVPEFKTLDTVEGKVRDAQKGSPAPFTDTPNPDGSIKRVYSAEGLKGYEHSFKKDGSVELKAPNGETTTFHGDTATVKSPPDGKVTELNKEQTLARKNELDKEFNKVGGEFAVDDKTKGTWKLDSLGNTQVDKVPGLTGVEGSMSIKPPNSKDGVKYHADIKAGNGHAGYSTEATGDATDGYRFVDYDDKQKGPNDPTTSDGKKSIEGFVSKRTGDKPLALVSDNHAGDGSITNTSVDGVRETTYNPAKNGKLSEKIYPPNHPSGLASESNFDPATHPDRLVSEQRKANGERTTVRATADNGIEVSEVKQTGESVKKYANAADRAANKPAWSRETDFNTGVIKSTYANGETATFTPGKPEVPAQGGRPLQPAVKDTVTLTTGNPPVAVSDARLAEFMKAPPALDKETVSPGRTRETRFDGKTVTEEKGVTKTESALKPFESEYTWTPPTKPSAADLAQMTGLKEGDSRLNNVTSVKDQGRGLIELTYSGDKDGKARAQMIRDGSGNVSEELRFFQTPDGKPKYSEYENKNGMTRTHQPKDGQVSGDQEVYNNKKPPELIRDSKVVGSVITTTDYEQGKAKRTEVIDDQNKTWKRTVDGKPAGEGKLLQGANGQRLYMDGDNKLVTGLVVPPGGVRAGDSYQFERGPDGSLAKMQVDVPAKGDKPAQKVNLEKKEGKWQTVPNDAKTEVPGFPAANADRNPDGTFKGEFSTNSKGELVYESGDKMTKQILRGDGSRDTYNMREYSRIKEGADGREGPKKFWDGYGSKQNPEDGWREGKATTDPTTGAITVEFTTPVANHPSKMVRNGSGENDSFEVTFPNGTGFKVGNWNDGKMSRTMGGKTETLYNTGTVGSDGHVQWVTGTPDAKDPSRIRFNDPRVQTGEIPAEVKIGGPNPGDKGKIVSAYADGTEVHSDLNGKPTKIKPGHKGSQWMERKFGPQGNLKGFEQGATTGELLRTNPADGTSDWNINKNGKNHKIEGATVKELPGGKFEIVSKDGKTKFESNGRLTTKEDGKDVVYDARGQKWTKTAEAVPADATKTPPVPATPPTWETGNPPQKFPGEMKLYDNGNVAIQTSADFAETVNSDGSVSKIDKNGFERERKNDADKTYQKRGEQGELIEFRNKDQSVTKLEYDRDPQTNKVIMPGGVRQVTTTDAGGKVIRSEKRDNPNPPTNPDGTSRARLRVESGGKVGNEVIYDRLGNRTEIEGTPENNVATVTDVNGSTRKIKTEGGRRTEISPGTTSDTKLTLQYDPKETPVPPAKPGDQVPITMKNGTDVYTREGTSNVYTLNGQTNKDAPRFTLDANGTLKPADSNIGIDPAFSINLEAQARRAPGDQPVGPTLTPAEIADLDNARDTRFTLEPGTMKQLRDLGTKMGLAEHMTPENLDKLFQAASDNNLLGSFSKANIAKMESDIRALFADTQNPASADKAKASLQVIDKLIKDPASLLAQLEQVKQYVPDSVKPLLNANFITALTKKAVTPPAPGR